MALRDLTRPGRRRTVLALLALVVVAVLGIAGAAALAGRRAATSLRAAKVDLERASALFDQGRYAEAGEATRAARKNLSAASVTLYDDPALQVVGAVPIASQNLGALRTAVSDALTLANGADRILRAAQPLVGPDGRLAVQAQGGQVPIDAVKAVATTGRELLDQLPSRRDRPDSRFLFPPLTRLRNTLRDETATRREQLASAVPSLELLADTTGGNGERNFLVLLANTAEMRGSGGMPLSFLLVRAKDGKVVTSSARTIDQLFLAKTPEGIDLPADLAERWKGFEPTRLWRNVNVDPSFEVIGPRAAAMFEAAGGNPVDGVIQLDPAGLAPFLALVGPVPSSVGPIGSDNVVDVTLNKAYTSQPDRDQRQEVLAEAATEAFKRLTSASFSSLRPLTDGLRTALDGRHIQAWSDHRDVQAILARVGASGALPDPEGADYVHLTLENVGANKLDYYVDTKVELVGSRLPGRRSEVLARITVANQAPKGGRPTYVFGTDGGVYKGVGSLYLPTGTTLLESEDPGVVVRPEAGRTVATFSENLAPQTSRTFTVRLLLPPRSKAPYRLTVVPSPRVRPTVWDIDLRTSRTASDKHLTYQGPTARSVVVGA